MSGLPCDTHDPEVDGVHPKPIDLYGGSSHSSSSSSLETVVGLEDTKFDADRNVGMAWSSPFADTVQIDSATTDKPSGDLVALHHPLIEFRSRTFRRILKQVFLAFLLIFVTFVSLSLPLTADNVGQVVVVNTDMVTYYPPMPEVSIRPLNGPKTSPIDWLRANSYDAPTYTLPMSRLQTLQATRPRAAFIALVRNSELSGMIHSITQVEARFNCRKTHRYDWVFFNNENFTEEFKAAVSNATSSNCYFEVIPQKHWATPDWIDRSRYGVGRQYMGSIAVGKAELESYHQMCRWNAGLFALEARLQNYDWYWRIEPNVQYTCNIHYDVFRFMRDNNMAYGFNMVILDDARSFPSLWERTQTFKKYNAEMVHPEADMQWLFHTTREPDSIIRSGAGIQAPPTAEEQYNNCQFYSNFEIGSLDYFRSEEHMAYFDYLDKSGGFFYERYGDAPVHTLSVSMFLPKRRVWFFRDIGYSHGMCENCPPHVSKLPIGPEPDHRRYRAADLNAGIHQGRHRLELLAKDFDQKRETPGLQCGCTSTDLDHNFSRLVPYESKQAKPIDTCIRLWLGGRYLLKTANWSRAREIAMGGSGYGGYLISGQESDPYTVDPSLFANLNFDSAEGVQVDREAPLIQL